ncbi:MAG: type VI secretion system contractile sheath small subunit [Acidobacteria bacterium]|nr:type VI secretion system contractile sheath small subunit [Acidobacteriota bacterium]
MAKESSVAPKERVNIVYKPATGGAKEEKELPLKLLMLGDYTLREEEGLLEDRKPISIDKDNFDEVMRSQGLSLTLDVPNKLAAPEESGEERKLTAKLEFKTMKDFNPAAIARQVPELNQLLELRAALTALKGPLGNLPAFRKKIESIIADTETREKLLRELGSDKEPE